MQELWTNLSPTAGKKYALRTLTFVISGRADSITKDLLASRVHAHWVAPKQIRHEICQMFYTSEIS